MSKVKMLRAFVQQRLTLAAEEIFELFESTIIKYEEKLCQQRKLLDAVFQPEVQLHRADNQLLMLSKEDPPEQQQWSPSLNQDNSAELPQIKEEHEERFTEEYLRTLEEGNIIKLTFSCVPVKSEVDEEKLKFTQLQQSQTKVTGDAQREDCGRLELDTHEKTSQSSDPEINDGYDIVETSEHLSGLKPLQINEEPVTNLDTNLIKRGDNGAQTQGKPVSCLICGKKYTQKKSVVAHMKLHSKFFRCLVCTNIFQSRTDLVRHMRIHTGEKPFSCSICGTRFSRDSGLRQHLRVHTGEKPFRCSVCGARFSRESCLRQHIKIHTGEKPFRCSVCGRTFARKEHLKYHSFVHTGERPYSCTICGKSYTQPALIKSHKCLGDSGGSN